MKDIVITAKRIRKERNAYIISFILAFIVNIIAIIIYDRPWTELFSQIGFVVAISIAFYIILWIPRLLIEGVKKLINK